MSATERIERFLAEYAKTDRRHADTIYGINHEVVTASDLREILSRAVAAETALAAAQARCAAMMAYLNQCSCTNTRVDKSHYDDCARCLGLKAAADTTALRALLTKAVNFARDAEKDDAATQALVDAVLAKEGM